MIYGTVDFAGNAGTGTLTGLIGDAGVVGIFKSDAETGATTSALAYVGGFTAAAPVPSFPNYSSFERHYGSQLPVGDDRTTEGGGGFLRGTSNGLNTAGLTLDADSSRNVVVRLGEVGSGHADYGSGFGVLRASNRYRAGLLSGTDLGAVLTSDITAKWTGKAYVIRSRGTGSGDLTLTVDFNAGTINTTTAAALTNGAGSLTVRGRFGSAHSLPDGILGGSVSYDSFNGALIGLIGDKGVLGVFHAGSNQLSAGGFYATPAPALPDATFATWADSFATGDLLAEDGVEATVASATEGTDSSHFIRGSATGIDGIYTEFSGGLARVTGLRLSDADTDNGVAFGYVTTGPGDNTALHFAGLLSGADVGAPITNIVTDVLWTGRIAGFIDEKRVNNSIQGSTLFLRISFTGDRGTIINWNGDGDPEESQGDAAAVSVGNSRFLSLVGGFTPAGVLTGTVKTGTNAVVTQGIQSGTFNGIIGQDGLLAVFKSDDANTVHFAGGFAAVPTGTTAPNSPFEVNVQAPDDNTGGGNGEDSDRVTTAYQAWATSLGDDLRASGYTPPTTGANSADFIRLNDSA